MTIWWFITALVWALICVLMGLDMWEVVVGAVVCFAMSARDVRKRGHRKL